MYKVLRLNDVMKNTGLAKSTIYKKIAASEFPQPILLGKRSVGWIESDIQNWIESKIAQPQTKNM